MKREGFSNEVWDQLGLDGEDFWYSSYRPREDGLSRHMFGLTRI